jgi:hypothetical protein
LYYIHAHAIHLPQVMVKRHAQLLPLNGRQAKVRLAESKVVYAGAAVFCVVQSVLRRFRKHHSPPRMTLLTTRISQSFATSSQITKNIKKYPISQKSSLHSTW